MMRPVYLVALLIPLGIAFRYTLGLSQRHSNDRIVLVSPK
jgi:hypothetical protein